ncbi:uncharacterized protein LOC123653306 [Pipistrellus kuhlii]|uniref:uncharacterized protein LOC123653306 n=1 Tax=Pipistrellus kuhlii TaxID=59472 RepID=UPI001E2720F1|nr:uncharacterized protein LOC123653306 [Pipistrellus kuhlii]
MGWPPCGSWTPHPTSSGWRPSGSGSHCSPTPRGSLSPVHPPSCQRTHLSPSLDTSLGCQFLPALCPPHPVLRLPAATKEGIWYETKNKNQTRYMQYLSVCTCKSSPAVGGSQGTPHRRSLSRWLAMLLSFPRFLFSHFLPFFFKLRFLSLSSVEGEMVAVSGVSSGRTQGLDPPASGHTRWTMSTSAHCPWDVSSVSRAGGTWQKRRSQLSSAPTRSSHLLPKDTRHARGRESRPGLASAHGSALRAVTWPESPRLCVSVSMCLISVLFHLCKGFAGAILCVVVPPPPPPRGLHSTAPPSVSSWAVCSCFLEKTQRPR